MRHFSQSDNFNSDVLTAKYHITEPSEYFFKDVKSATFKKGLVKLDSSSSLSSHSSSDGCDSATSFGKQQPCMERKHKNFQVKKKTEVKTFPFDLTNLTFFSTVKLINLVLSVLMETNVPSPTELMNSGPKFLFPPTIKPSSASNFSKRDFAILDPDASSSMTCLSILKPPSLL